MDYVLQLLGACTSVDKADRENDASDMQLSAFEFRQYQTSLESSQQRLVERVVNQWVAMLVKGMIMRVNGFEEKTFLDRDLLNLELNGEVYPLDALCRMEMYKESDDNIVNIPWVVELIFDFEEGETILAFAFDRERHRLQFALTLRVLRTRNPSLNLAGEFEVITRDEEGDENGPSLRKLVSSNRYDVQGMGITVVISIGTLKVMHQLRSNNRHVYLEFFSDYPRRDKFLYARSSYNNLPGSVLLTDDSKKNPKDEEKTEEGRKKGEQALCRIDFDLKNVKLKIPKVPFTIHGRLMAKDDFFPTVVASFQLQVTKEEVFDRRNDQPVTKNPDFIEVPLERAWRGEGPSEIAALSVRFLGYVKDDMVRKKQSGQQRNASCRSQDSGSSDSEGAEEGEEEDESDDEEEEENDDEDEEGNANALGSSGTMRSSQTSSGQS